MSIHSMPVISHCPACGKVNDKVYLLGFTGFRHLDFSPLGTPATWTNSLCVCESCTLIYRLFDADQQRALAALYQSIDYAEHQENHLVHNGDKLQRACEAQADALIAALPSRISIGAILDIGCFDGKLLLSLAQRTTSSRMVGYDIASRTDFPRLSGFEFWTGSLKQFPGLFDLILLSQSLIYIADLAELFTELDRMLADGGRIFVHVPNTASRPASLLLADQLFHFTRESLARLFLKHGYSVDFLTFHPFHRDILLLAYRHEKEPSQVDSVQSSESDIFKLLEQSAMRIRAVKGNEIAIFGTTIEAAFAHSLISERVSCFIDENPVKQEYLFGGLPVLSPQALNATTTCIIPMGTDATHLARRLAASFPCKFLLI